MAEGNYEIFHNPRCSKSREALRRLKDAGHEPVVVEYLKETPTEAELRALLRKLGVSAHEIVRRKEPAYRAAGLSADSSEDAVIAAIVEQPILLERPIVVAGERAVVARPTERLDEIL